MTIVFGYFDNSKEQKRFLLKTDYSFQAKQGATLPATFAVN